MFVRLLPMLAIIVILPGLSDGSESTRITTTTESIEPRHLIVHKTFRGDECILIRMISPELNTRQYLIDGIPILIESDTTGDGIMDRRMITDSKSGRFEVFVRSKEDEFVPLGSSELERMRDAMNRGIEAFQELVEQAGGIEEGTNGDAGAKHTNE